jgi:hypothetical protein
MRGGAVAGQIDQVATGFAVKEAGADPAVLILTRRIAP